MRFVVPDLDNPNAHPKAVRRAVAQRAQAVRQAFQDHNERIRPLLPPSLQRLQDTDLNDGLIQSLRIDPGQKTLQLCLLCGDFQQGYFDLKLHYQDIQLTPMETSLLCFIAHEEGAEIYGDEIDVKENAGSPQFLHRILWQTHLPIDRKPTSVDFDGETLYKTYTLDPEIELRFGGFEIEIIPRSDRQLSRSKDAIAVIRDPNKIAGME